MVSWKDDDSITLTQVDVAQSDILNVKCKIPSTTFTLVLVYMSVNDYTKNIIIYQYIQSNLAYCASYIIMGLQWTYWISWTTYNEHKWRGNVRLYWQK